MEQKRLEEILEQFGVRATPVRSMLYQALEHSKSAMSLTDLELELETVDKSSIFRNLQLFMEVGMIHQIQDGSGVAKYATSQLGSDELPLNHAHFCCRKCSETICLDHTFLDISELTLPEGYYAEGYSLVLKGVCKHCKRS